MDAHANRQVKSVQGGSSKSHQLAKQQGTESQLRLESPKAKELRETKEEVRGVHKLRGAVAKASKQFQRMG